MAETYENILGAVTPEMTDYIRVVTAGGLTKRTLVSALAYLLLEEDRSDIETTSKTVIGAINELSENTSGRVTQVVDDVEYIG